MAIIISVAVLILALVIAFRPGYTPGIRRNEESHSRLSRSGVSAGRIAPESLVLKIPAILKLIIHRMSSEYGGRAADGRPRESRRHCKSVVVVLTLFLLALLPGTASAQQSDSTYSRNAIYVEGLGAGLLYSVNYDRRLTPNFSVRVGFASWSVPSLFVLINGEFSYTAFPVTANYLYGDGASHVELGVGVVPGYVSITGEEVFFGNTYREHATTLLGTGSIAYRLQPRDGGFFFRIGYTPLFTFKKIFSWGGVSVGAAF